MPVAEVIRVERYVNDLPEPNGSNEYAPPLSWGSGWEFVGMTMTTLSAGRLEVLIAWKRGRNGR